MEYVTVGKKYNQGKIAAVKCVKEDSLKNINIKGKCFLLVILTKGELRFSVNHNHVTAQAPCFVCFDELENPQLLSKQKAEYTCVYFHPQYLNVNITFEFLRSQTYLDIAGNHDMFLLKPFTDGVYTIPIIGTQVEKIVDSAQRMQEELEYQRDWYWSCRGRSYFMEIIIALERMYGLMGYGISHQSSDNTPIINHPKLRDAVLFMEGHYSKLLTLKEISVAAGINHTTLTALMKQELGCTAMEYLMGYRVAVAKKQLAFTDVPIKDIAGMVGFKTVPHFHRIFKEYTGTTPARFRKSAVQKRKEEIK